MDPLWRTALWQQFGATIDMLENALLTCPSTHWSENSQWGCCSPFGSGFSHLGSKSAQLGGSFTTCLVNRMTPPSCLRKDDERRVQ